jgi:hypothetical protein
VFDDPKMGWSRWAHTIRVFTLNSGLFYIRPNQRTIGLMDRITARLMKEKAWDQAVFNEEIWFPSHGEFTGSHIRCGARGAAGRLLMHAALGGRPEQLACRLGDAKSRRVAGSRVGQRLQAGAGGGRHWPPLSVSRGAAYARPGSPRGMWRSSMPRQLGRQPAPPPPHAHQLRHTRAHHQPPHTPRSHTLGPRPSDK